MFQKHSIIVFWKKIVVNNVLRINKKKSLSLDTFSEWSYYEILQLIIDMQQWKMFVSKFITQDSGMWFWLIIEIKKVTTNANKSNFISLYNVIDIFF